MNNNQIPFKCLGCEDELVPATVRAYKNGTMYYDVHVENEKLVFSPDFFPTSEEFIYVCRGCGKPIIASVEDITRMLETTLIS